MKKIVVLFLATLIWTAAAACSARTAETVAATAAAPATAPTVQPTFAAVPANETMPLLKIEVNGNILYADFTDNSSAEALKEQLQYGGITLPMSDYGGFEKVGDLPFSLVTDDAQITAQPGDVILYQGDKLTIYYGTNTWSFTKIAQIRNIDGSLQQLLGEGEQYVTFSLY